MEPPERKGGTAGRGGRKKAEGEREEDIGALHFFSRMVDGGREEDIGALYYTLRIEFCFCM